MSFSVDANSVSTMCLSLEWWIDGQMDCSLTYWEITRFPIDFNAKIRGEVVLLRAACLW